ncbi:MAG: M50 family metallopeptidase [Armatimonadota bacterium]
MSLIGILGALIVFGGIIVFHEFGHFIIAKLSKMDVHEFSVGFGPALFKKKLGDTLYALRIIPLGGYVRIAGMESGEEDSPNGYDKKPFLAKFGTILAGATMNFVLAFIVMVILGLAIGYPLGSGPAVVGAVQESSPAFSAGIKPGDVIVEINGNKAVDAEHAPKLIRGSTSPVAIVLERQGQRHTMSVALKEMPSVEINGIHIKKVTYKGIGIVIEPPPQRVGALQAVSEGLRQVYHRIVFALANVVYIFSGQARFDEIGGPVKIISLAHDSAKDALGSSVAMGNFLSLFAMLSVLVGFFNLLPIPALDGSHLMFLTIEAIRGKPFNKEKQAMVHMIGMAILLGLIAIITFKDIYALFTGPK